MRRLHILILFAVFILTALVGVARPEKKHYSTAENIEKAEYIYLEAVSAYEENRIDDYYMLLRRAKQLNPDDPFINGNLAEITITMPTADSLMREDAYSAIANRFEVDPTVDHNSQTFNSVASYMGRHDDLIHIWETLDSLMPSRTDPALNLAYSLLARYSVSLDTADYNRSVAILNRLENAVGPTVPLMIRKMRAYMLRNDTTSIVRDLGRLAQSAPADVETSIFVGRIFEAINKPDSALFYFDRAGSIDPYDGAVNLARAEFFNHRGDSVAFDREVFLALQSQSIDFPEKMSLLTDYVSNLYTDSLQRPRIEQMFETMQEINPGEAELHGLYGAYKATVGEMDAAAEQFSYSLDLHPDNHGMWENLISVYSNLRRNNDIIATARKAVKLYPGDFLFYIMGAMALEAEGDAVEALAMLDSINVEGLRLDRVSSVYATRGDILYKLGKKEEAFNAYSSAIEYDAENYMAMNNCAYYMSLSNIDLDKAERYSAMATAAEPDNITYIDTYAWVFFKKKDYRKAKEIIDRALVVYGSFTQDSFVEKDDLSEDISSEIYDHAGDIYFMNGEHQLALDFWRKALTLDAGNSLLRKKVEHKTIFFE
ncbi:MAG: hypothetical protein J1F05_07820 [Muribaculaceae bacterium]|nr:hypothetical protein [Muribaculaceae bacterium]